MRQVMVRYRVAADRAGENERLVRAVYEELEESGPRGLRYATFKLEDGVSFIHIAETGEGENPLAEVKAFQEFQAGIGERCVEPPVVSQLSEVGSYRLFGGQA
jgi:hypothetical protein